MTEDKMAGWHHQLNGHEFEQTPGDGEGQGGLMSMGSQGSDTTEPLNNSCIAEAALHPSQGQSVTGDLSLLRRTLSPAKWVE